MTLKIEGPNRITGKIYIYIYNLSQIERPKPITERKEINLKTERN